jgi:hypothetical protein
VALRDYHSPADIQRPQLKELLANPVECTARLAGLANLSSSHMKQQITAASNLKVDRNLHADVVAWLVVFKNENKAMMEHQARLRPTLFAQFHCEKHPLLSFMSAIDIDWEAQVVDKFDHGKAPVDQFNST